MGDMTDLMERMALVQTRRPRASCPLLELLSLDDLLLIADVLEPASLLVLSQTCRALRVAFWRRLYPDSTPQAGGVDDSRSRLTRWCQGDAHDRNGELAPGNATETTIKSFVYFMQWLGVGRPCRSIEVPALGRSREQRLNFLACIARDRPERKVVGAMVPWCHQLSSYLVAPRIWVQDPYPAYTLYHRHVQIALKYTRLGAIGHEDAGGARWRYMERLLAPFKDYKYDDMSKIVVRYSVQPRIVGDRFLLAGEWHCYHTAQGSPREMRFVVPCLHQRYRPRDWSYVGPAESSRDGLARAICELSTSPYRIEVRGACGRCPTDFSVQGTPGHATIRYWQDFGPEGSPDTSIWTSQLKNGPHHAHEPGSIRRLYESSENDLWETSSLVPSMSG